ncbi:PLC-like phosphodiesterase [Flagelloscypha sp. PMI_526]|nr:PLC-like phosphodiesterase [Flagelloscypha sp. PMI_526]
MFPTSKLSALSAIIPFLAYSLLFLSPLQVQASISVNQKFTAFHRRASDCNGSSALCSKSYGSVTMVGAHDSYAVGTNNVFVNQDHDVTQQLTDGIRMLQMQAHNKNGVIQLCHSSCSFYDGGTLEDYLKKVKSWMDSNPNNVVTLLIVNINNLAASKYDEIFKSVGLDSRSFKPTSSPLTVDAWPTLGSMIDAGTNLVTFLDNGADSSIPYLLDEFSNMWETAYNVVDANQLSSDCAVNRTSGDSATQLYLINHFLDKLVLGQPAPDVDKANVTNSASGDANLAAQVQACKTANGGRAPNFLLVDFYEYGGGSVFQIAAGINGVDYNPSTPIAQPATSTSFFFSCVSVLKA